MKRMIAIHLLNDRSGSPMVLREALEVLREGYDITLFTATPRGSGFLSGMEGVRYKPIFYRHSPARVLTLCYFLLSQVLLFFRLLIVLRRDDTVYVNTLLPFAAAWAARCKGCTVIYHIHETSLKPRLLKKWLVSTASVCASRVLFVSAYVQKHYRFDGIDQEVIYNCLSEHFIAETAAIQRVNATKPFTVAMLCSLKAYKGVDNFISIARRLPGMQFELVLNADQAAVDRYKAKVRPPANCKLYPAQRHTAVFYSRAHIILNLSRPEGWTETFGLTLLEAMHCGRPVICPVEGGVLELVTDGVQGYTIDSSNEEQIAGALLDLSVDEVLYRKLSASALLQAAQFSRQRFALSLKRVCGGYHFHTQENICPAFP